MKSVTGIFLCGLIILFVILAAGCVAPPKGTASTSGSNGYSGVATSEPTTTAPNYVSEATPFLTTVPEAQETTPAYATLPPTPTPVPQDLSCLIYLNTQYFNSNATAVEFNLKNPPMYINYSVVPFNVTVTKVFTSNYGSTKGQTQTMQYSDYAPYSWYKLTVRNKTSGEVYLQDGFGPAQSLSVYTSATFKVLNTGDLLIEMSGNNITATTGVWVKPYGNFDDPGNRTYAECKYWGGAQNSLQLPTATTTATWTPENIVPRYTTLNPNP